MKTLFNTVTEIVYLQGEEAQEALGILHESGTRAAIEYLSQWDNGDSHEQYIDDAEMTETRRRSGSGPLARLEFVDDYIVAYSHAHEYIGLSKIKKKIIKCKFRIEEIVTLTRVHEFVCSGDSEQDVDAKIKAYFKMACDDGFVDSEGHVCNPEIDFVSSYLDTETEETLEPTETLASLYLCMPHEFVGQTHYEVVQDNTIKP